MKYLLVATEETNSEYGSGGGCWVPGAGEDISLMFFVLRNTTPHIDRIACRQGQRQGRWNPRSSQSSTRLWSSGSKPVPSPETHHSLFSIPVVCSLGSSDSRHSLLPPSQECPQALRTAFPVFRRSWLVLDFLRREESLQALRLHCPLVDTLTSGLISFRLRDRTDPPGGLRGISGFLWSAWVDDSLLEGCPTVQVPRTVSAVDRHACGQHPVSRKSCCVRTTANLGPVAWSLFWRRGWIWTL